MRAPNSTAQLIELCETEVVRAIYEHRVRVRHVEARLDDHRRDKHIDFARDELVHDVFQITLSHLTVANRDARTRDDAPNAIGNGFDRLDAIVHEEDLATAIELA